LKARADHRLDSLHQALSKDRLFLDFLQQSHKTAAMCASGYVLHRIRRLQKVFKARDYQVIYVGAGHFGAHFGHRFLICQGRREDRRSEVPPVPVIPPPFILRRSEPNCFT
jgi:hypothetical protein